MKYRNIAAIFFMATMLCGVSAYTVSSIEISPAGDLPSGTPVTIRGVIEFPVNGSVTFAERDELQLYSELVRPTWNYTLVLNGKETPQPTISGRVLAISGWILSYPSLDLRNETVRFNITGTTPVLNGTENIKGVCVSLIIRKPLSPVYRQPPDVHSTKVYYTSVIPTRGEPRPDITLNVSCDYEHQITVIASPAPTPATLQATLPLPTTAGQQQSLLDRIFNFVKDFFGLR